MPCIPRVAEERPAGAQSSSCCDKKFPCSKLTIVVPVLNEEEAIGKVLEELMSEGYEPEQILVVDGGSVDRTVEIASGYGVKVIRQEGRGKAAAIRTAMKHVKTEFVLVMDGDYTYPAKHIRELLNKALEGGYDQVIGRREFAAGTQPLAFKVGNRLLTLFFNLLFGVRLRDVLSGMYVVRAERLREIAWETKGFSIETEIAAHVASTTGRVAEHPIEYRRRVGRKKLKLIHGLHIARDMVRLAWRYNPAFFIFMLGSVLLIPGLALGLYVAYHYLFTGIKYYIKGLAAMMMTMAGLQSLVLAILALYMKRMEYRISRKLSELLEAGQR